MFEQAIAAARRRHVLCSPCAHDAAPHCAACGEPFPCEMVAVCDAAAKEVARLLAMLERDGGVVPRDFGVPVDLAGMLDSFKLFFGAADLRAAKARLGNSVSRDEALMYVCADVVAAAIDARDARP